MRQLYICLHLSLLALTVVLTLHAACDCAPGVFNDPSGEPEAYYLPLSAGTRTWVGQGYNGVLSHRGEYAVDFIVPEGTPIAAARGGTVIDLREDSTCNDWTILGPDYNDPDCRWNFVEIRHADDTIAVYGHLAPHGALVDVGRQVARGEVIALSGHTGFSFTPHLHFAVSNPPVEVHFADVCGDGVPQFGWWYTSQNPAPECAGL